MKLLREPNGLAAVAKIVGHYDSVDDVCVWGTGTLGSLISGSTQIVEGTITGSEGQLTDNGDDIATRYVMIVSRTMKGPVSNQVAFYAHGGTIEFPNGTTAHIATVETDNIRKGGQYIVFLKDEDGRKVLQAPASAVIVSSPERNTVSTFDDKDVHTEGTRAELSKMTRGDLIQYILNRAN
ncbi:MAG TPA: hypothetical protein VHT28_15355 [Silvibacterium sp.]|nr:hypothetical protein [Silvibacterium sp.]